MTEKEAYEASSTQRTVVDTTNKQRGIIVEIDTEPDGTLTAAFIPEGTRRCRYVDLDDLQAS